MIHYIVRQTDIDFIPVIQQWRTGQPLVVVTAKDHLAGPAIGSQT